MSSVSREDKVNEALARMKKLDYYKDAVRDFKKGHVMFSEGFGTLFYLTDEMMKAVDEFEKEYDGLVYAVIRNVFREIGECWSFLYVSDHVDEWEDDNRLIDRGETLAYVYDKDAPEFSEIGYIGIRPSFGGLVRTY